MKYFSIRQTHKQLTACTHLPGHFKIANTTCKGMLSSQGLLSPVTSLLIKWVGEKGAREQVREPMSTLLYAQHVVFWFQRWVCVQAP